jgi:polysaccharide export outer membrane protein
MAIRIPDNCHSRLRTAFGGITLATLMAACAYAPGMRVATDGRAAVSTPAQLVAISPETIAEQRREAGARAPSVAELMTPQSTYRIGVGDVLGITLWSHPELNLPATLGTTSTIDPGAVPSGGNIPAGFTVEADGQIQYGLVGNLQVKGLTDVEIRQKLEQALRRFLKDPQVTVRVQAYRSQKVFLDGELRTPGQQAITDIPMTLAEALWRAGGLTATADSSRVRIIRGDRFYDVSLPDLTERGINPARLTLQDGDLVKVFPREESRVFVLGEVARPAPVFLRNGKLNLNEALGEAGGVNSSSANAGQIYVIRNEGTDSPAKVFHLDARSPVKLALADGFELRARDVVYVDAAPLAQWNRVVSLLLPTTGAVQNAAYTSNAVQGR